MAIDTLSFTKELEAAGVERNAAEAHALALTHHVLPDLATKHDLAELKHDMTVRTLTIVAALNGILFALLRFTH